MWSISGVLSVDVSWKSRNSAVPVVLISFPVINHFSVNASRPPLLKTIIHDLSMSTTMSHLVQYFSSWLIISWRSSILSESIAILSAYIRTFTRRPSMSIPPSNSSGRSFKYRAYNSFEKLSPFFQVFFFQPLFQETYYIEGNTKMFFAQKPVCF